MLQQTRVAAVLDHYQKFIRRFPTIATLAKAREASILAVWSGLGYYRRARMLHRAAKKVVGEYNGKLPNTAAQLRELPGIGRYTAAAIASIAFDEPEAAVDGNVERVLSRLHRKSFTQSQVWIEARRLLSCSRPGDFNQSMMELGATVCLPRQPKCLLCPVSKLCATRGELPARVMNKRQQKREVHYLLDSTNDAVFLVQRPKDESLMPGFWELPEHSADFSKPTWLTLRHSITVTDYTVRVIRGPVSDQTLGTWVPIARLAGLPLTGLARKILKAASSLPQG